MGLAYLPGVISNFRDMQVCIYIPYFSIYGWSGLLESPDMFEKDSPLGGPFSVLK